MFTSLAKLVQAGVPVVTVSVRSTYRIQDLLTAHVGMAVGSLQEATVTVSPAAKGSKTVVKPPIFRAMYTLIDAGPERYREALTKGYTLIVVNAEAGEAFHLGELPLHPNYIKKQLSEFQSQCAVQDIPGCVSACRTLSTRGLLELLLLLRGGGFEINPKTIARHVPLFNPPAAGLLPVSTEQEVYIPNAQLSSYVEENRGLFSLSVPARLRPRGLLLSGLPGTGKTEAAKYLAQSWGCALYALDMSSIVQKYQGDSERRFSEALAHVTVSSPAVLLLDEVEKLFSGTEDTGTTYRILAKLLWFLQDHQEMVLTVMTANKTDSIPPELYRPGRIDKSLQIRPYRTVEEVTHHIERVFHSFTSKGIPPGLAGKAHSLLQAGGGEVVQAAVSGEVYTYLKAHPEFWS